MEIVGECCNAIEAMQAPRVLRPDLLFPDIQMPGMDGFELLHELAPDRLPLSVFATAFAEHALRAFDAMTLDYVLKPIDQARFNQAMTRVNRHWLGLHADTGAATEPAPANGCVQRLSVSHGEQIRVLAVDDIDWIRADGNYLHIHLGPMRYLYRDTLRHMLAQLDPAYFLRPSRHPRQGGAHPRGASAVQGRRGDRAARWNQVGSHSALPRWCPQCAWLALKASAHIH